MATRIEYWPGSATKRFQWGPSDYFVYDVGGVLISTRPLTGDELAWLAYCDQLDVALANRDALTAKAQQALTTNAAFLALASPTNAQTLAQVRVLTRECNAIIRLLLNQLDMTDGT